MRRSHTKTKAQKIQGSVVSVVKALSEAHVIVGAATKKAIARGAHQISFSLTRKKRPKNSITTDKQKLEKKTTTKWSEKSGVFMHTAEMWRAVGSCCQPIDATLCCT